MNIVPLPTGCIHCAVKIMIETGAFGGPENAPQILSDLMQVVVELINSCPSKADQSVLQEAFRRDVRGMEAYWAGAAMPNATHPAGNSTH